MSLVILLLAAGASSRMRGGDKLLEQVDGAPLVATMAIRAARVAPVIVALPALDHPRAAALSDTGATLLPVPDAAEGMAASIRTGAVHAPPALTGLMVLPADMPDLTSSDLQTIANAWRADPDRIHRAAAADGTPGHPVIFPADLLPELAKLTGDTGARALLKAHKPREVRLTGRHALTDLDTPEDWAAWRARPASSG